MSQDLPKVVVLGIGNLLLRDEGVGVHFAHFMKKEKLNHPNLEIIDEGTSPDILSLDSEIGKLIIVDAIKMGRKPGTIYQLRFEDLKIMPRDIISLHEIGVVEKLKIMMLLGKLPKSTVIIGIEPKVIDWGIELSPEIEGKMPKILDLVLQEINRSINLKEDI